MYTENTMNFISLYLVEVDKFLGKKMELIKIESKRNRKIKRN